MKLLIKRSLGIEWDVRLKEGEVVDVSQELGDRLLGVGLAELVSVDDPEPIPARKSKTKPPIHGTEGKTD